MLLPARAKRDAELRRDIHRVCDEDAAGRTSLREPVNRFPDVVRYLVQRLKVHCPSIGSADRRDPGARGLRTLRRILVDPVRASFDMALDLHSQHSFRRWAVPSSQLGLGPPRARGSGAHARPDAPSRVR